MEKDMTKIVNENTKNSFENGRLTQEAEPEDSENGRIVLQAKGFKAGNVKERIVSCRRNKNLCRIAAAITSVIVAVIVFCFAGKSYYEGNCSDISLAYADTTFVNALQGDDSFKVDLKNNIRLQKDSIVSLATINKIKAGEESAAAQTELTPLDVRLAAKVKPAEDIQTTKAISLLMLLLCVFLSLIIYIVAYNLIYKSKLPELCYMMNAKDIDELINKIHDLKNEKDKIQKEKEDLNTIISNKTKEFDDLKISQQSKQIGNAQSVLTIEQIRGIHKLGDVQSTEDAILRITELAKDKELSEKFVKSLNNFLPSSEQITLECYTPVISILKKDSENPKTTEQNIDLDQLIRNHGTNDIKEIWKECGKDEKIFFGKLAKCIKPQQEITEKSFLDRLKYNGFGSLIVDNTTVTSLWNKVCSHFEQQKIESEKALTEQKDHEIATINADLNNLRETSQKLLEKIKDRAKNDFGIDLSEKDTASQAFDTFCNQFKELKNELSVISKLKEILGLSNEEEIDKSSVKNNIKDAIARELINGCSCLEGVEHFDGIKPQLSRISNQIKESMKQAEQAEKRLADEKTSIHDAYKVIFDSDLVATNMEDSFSKFKDKAIETIDGLRGNVAVKEEKIKTANEQIANQRSQIDKLESEVTANKEQMKTYSDTFLIRLHKDVSTITKMVRDNRFLRATLKDGGFGSKLNTIYGKVENGATLLLDKTQKLTVKEDAKPEDIFKKVQDLLRKEINDTSGFINLIAQYYAYSRLPFMSDNNAEYGLQFNRAGIKKIYEAIVQLLADFNITLQVPALYAEYGNDWGYEDVTGGAQKGLDFLIPDAANHVQNVDNSRKDGLILDFSEVGYTIDGQTEKQAKIIL